MKKIKTVLLLGSGALKIGEAGEFDYSGTQAMKALKEEGLRVILVNPNIATVQSSQGLADEVYFVPVTSYFVEKVIKREKPDGILISFGGQTALNCGMELAKQGILQKYNVKVLGSPIEAVIDTEDREKFAKRLKAIGLLTAKGQIVSSVEDGLAYAENTGYPVMVRSGFALGGSGSGIAKNPTELINLVGKALAVTSQVIIEESLSGWKEIEYEVVRDTNGNIITVCNMENMDPVGIHTGESIVVAPSQTLTNDEYYGLRKISTQVIAEFGIVGECNIQFALRPAMAGSELPFDYRIIEVNARLSRSSALASKATGYPLAYIGAKLALGKALPELHNSVTGKTSAFFEPALDYIVVKIPRWDLDKYDQVSTQIGSEMKSVGEVMSIGRTFEEAIQKATRMLNDGYEGVLDPRYSEVDSRTALTSVAIPSPLRLFSICTSLLAGKSVKSITRITGIDPWFVWKLQTIVDVYTKIRQETICTKDLLLTAKKTGFSDRQIAWATKQKTRSIRARRKKFGIVPCIKQIDTMAGEFPARTNYLYMTYNASQSDHIADKNEKLAVIGAGPYSIGTSVEFDWCAVMTLNRLRELGVGTVMINSNPETVSTDYDMSDILYFEELTLERILDIYDVEHAPYIVSVGGQIPNSLIPRLSTYGIPTVGTTPENIMRAEDRKTFSHLLDTLDIAQPAWGQAKSLSQARAFVQKHAFPILIRPSFVLSGKAMRVIESEVDLEHYLATSHLDLREHPLVITQFFRGATECDVDGVAVRGDIKLSALSSHIEPAGVHSGDSTLQFPSNIQNHLKEILIFETRKIIKSLDVTGPFNIQFLIRDDQPYVIECNLRASRSFPFVSKVSGKNLITAATDAMLGRKVQTECMDDISYMAVKVPQFSFHKLRGADPITRVEMSSTGEVATFGMSVGEALLKGQIATGMVYPEKKAVLVSLGGKQGKLRFLKSSVRLVKMGYTLFATDGTAFFLQENGIDCVTVAKLHEDTRHPNAHELFSTHMIDFAVVISGKMKDSFAVKSVQNATDGYTIRRMAIDFGIPLFTNVEKATAIVDALHDFPLESLEVLPWSHYQKLAHT